MVKARPHSWGIMFEMQMTKSLQRQQQNWKTFSSFIYFACQAEFQFSAAYKAFAALGIDADYTKTKDRKCFFFSIYLLFSSSTCQVM